MNTSLMQEHVIRYKLGVQLGKGASYQEICVRGTGEERDAKIQELKRSGYVIAETYTVNLRKSAQPTSATLLMAYQSNGELLFVRLVTSEDVERWCQTSFLYEEVSRIDLYQAVKEGITFLGSRKRPQF